jgi:hypothetical protein
LPDRGRKCENENANGNGSEKYQEHPEIDG